MTRVLMTLAILAILAPLPGVLLGPVVVLVAVAVAALAVWSHRADPPVWHSPGPNWSGRFA